MKKSYLVIALVLATFFTVSFITNILGAIFPALIESYDIGLTLAGFFPFAFFIAYGVMSIPAGLLVQRVGEKSVMQLAFTLAAMGATTFVLLPSFAIAMVALFMLGCAMALLQVAINPLLRASGGAEHFAVLSVLAQLMFGAAATLAPLVYSKLQSQVTNAEQVGAALTHFIPADKSWLSIYVVFALLSVAMLVLSQLTPFSAVPEQKKQKLSWSQSVAFFNNKTALKFFAAIAAYVALEQGVANLISAFLQQYHGLEPTTQGAKVVSEFWLCLTLGCLFGLALLKFIDAQKLLVLFSLGAATALLCALFGSTAVALVAFPLVGFFLSIMWSVIFALALNSFKTGHGAITGILCTGIIGGAFMSPIIGLAAELSDNLQLAALLLLLPLSYILSVGVWANPLIKNKTFGNSQKMLSHPLSENS
ncbi:MFS transporter [Pseudoalteromonas sp. PS5]|uniref:MFS transporter n=1 Tax=Pseudoalteromonas sp. PS5 TaxID=1437473 RepID=UPI000FFF66EF|nr:MFS transporter [Pseudoalteromonas sp. PS5]RXF04975.1 MFS transporter [Pseudoalteromonas sp. PS5]